MADQFKVDETVDFESEFGESGTAFPMPDALKSEKILENKSSTFRSQGRC